MSMSSSHHQWDSREAGIDPLGLEGPTTTLGFSVATSRIPREHEVSVLDFRSFRQQLRFRSRRKRRRMALHPLLEQLQKENVGTASEQELDADGSAEDQGTVGLAEEEDLEAMSDDEDESDSGATAADDPKHPEDDPEDEGDDYDTEDDFFRPVQHLRRGRRRAARAYIEPNGFIDDSEIMSDSEEVNDQFVLAHHVAKYGFFVCPADYSLPVQPIAKITRSKRASRKRVPRAEGDVGAAGGGGAGGSTGAATEEQLRAQLPAELQQYLAEIARLLAVALANSDKSKLKRIPGLEGPLRRWKAASDQLPRRIRSLAISELVQVLPWRRETVLKHLRSLEDETVSAGKNSGEPQSSSSSAGLTPSPAPAAPLPQQPQQAPPEPVDPAVLEKLRPLDHKVETCLKALKKAVAAEFPRRVLPVGADPPAAAAHIQAIGALVEATRRQWHHSKQQLGNVQISQEEAVQLVLRRAKRCWPKDTVTVDELRLCYDDFNLQNKKSGKSKAKKA